MSKEHQPESHHQQGRQEQGQSPFYRAYRFKGDSFECYQDQVDNLRDFALEEKRRGEKGSMSEMVREALDFYIAKRHRLED